MKIEIDQSIKIESTNKDTILVFSDGIYSSVLITAKTKRQLQEIFRKVGEPRSFILRVFTAGIALLIKPYLSKITELVIDNEYDGYEKVIKELLISFLNLKSQVKQGKLTIRFASIGKKSKAHLIGYNIYIKKKRANKIVSFDDMRKLCFKNIKNE